MSELDNLEPQQYERQYWEEDVPLADVRKSALRKLVYYGTAAFVLLVILGATIQFPDQVELPFTMKSAAKDESYDFPYPVYVVSKHVAVGQTVARGQTLVKITSPEIVALINDLSLAKETLVHFREDKNLSTANRREIIAMRIKEASEKIRSTGNERTAIDNAWKTDAQRLEFEQVKTQKKLASDRELFSNKYISDNELKTSEAEAIAAADALNRGSVSYTRERSALTSQLSQLELAILSLKQEEAMLASDTKFDSSLLRSRFEAAASKITHTFGEYEISEGALLLKANGPGKVTYLFEGDRELRTGSSLVKIAHSGSDLYAFVSCPPTLIGKLRNNQVAHLKLATFPAYEWGSVKGQLTTISGNYDEHGDFNVHISVQDERKLKGLLRAGMTGKAVIILDERTFFQYFFRAMNKAYYKATMND